MALSMKIGIVSDTHGFFDERLANVLAGVEVILHAGDVGSKDVLDQLSAMAPTRAVRGNVDNAEMGLPVSLSMKAGDMMLQMLHVLPGTQAELQSWSCEKNLSDAATRRRDRLTASFLPATRIVVFGHSHQPGIYRLGQLLLVNPGSAGKKRFALPRCCGVMEVTGSRVRVKIISLEDYNEIMRGSFSVTPGGFAACSP